MIHVIATIELKPGRRPEFLEEFRKLVLEVRAEEGCIEYGATVDVDTGLDVTAPPRPDVVTVIEKWESVHHLRAHLGAPHMSVYRGRVKDIVRGTSIQVTEPA